MEKNFSYSNFDVVIFSSSIKNKQKIVERIKKTTSRDILLIDRKIYGLGRYIYQSSEFAAGGNEIMASSSFGLIKTSCCFLNVIGQ